jgi:hypothetical protein
MKSMNGWTLKLAAATLVAVTMMACSDSAVPTTAAPSASAPGASLSAPGDVSKSVDPCPGGICDGGGGGGGTPTNTIKLTWFEDQSGGASGNYYELRQGVYNFAGTGVGYTPFRIHGNSFPSGEFTSLDTGVQMPCGGHLHLALWQGTVGATIWTFVGDVDVSSSENGIFKGFNNFATNSQAIVRYTWTSCV